MKSRLQKTLLMAVLAFIATSLACSRAEPKTEHELAAEEAAKPLPKGAVIDPMVKSQSDIGLKATIEGDRLRVSVLNKTKKPLIVGPKNLALLVKGENEPQPFDPNDTGFPITRLQPGSEQVGLLRMRGAALPPRGTKVLFSHPECKPAFTYVK